MAVNDGRYKISAEAKRAHRVLCQDLKSISEGADKDAKAANARGDLEGAYEGLSIAVASHLDAKQLGCRWAS